jgi:hypothetical protein
MLEMARREMYSSAWKMLRSMKARRRAKPAKIREPTSQAGFQRNGFREKEIFSFCIMGR